MKLDISVTTNKGKRSHNEDNFVCKNKIKKLCIDNLTIRTNGSIPCVCCVCDGMGGLSAGEQYSYLASNYIRHTMKISVWNRLLYKIKRKEIPFHLSSMERMIQELNNAVYQATRHMRDGGTTLAMLLFMREQILAVNVGDSRIYTYKDSKLSQISMDHNDKYLKPPYNEDVPLNIDWNTLSQYIGISPDEMMIEPYITEVKMEPMIFLLCSDGLTERLHDVRIQQILEENSDKKSNVLSQLLVDEALKLGTKDNVTALIVKLTL